MMAVAKSEIVHERIDTLIKVGLGHLGKSDLALARYTCIALQRISGSVKKVKGSLSDASIRLPMSEPIFRRLQEAIELPTTSQAWFGMAEQAINTIYVLGEQPDILCNVMIKHMAAKAFTTTNNNNHNENEMQVDGESENYETGNENQSIGNAFLLSQLVFTVGHVAIRHVVYLELVERELKRRKAEAEKGEMS